MKVQSEWIGRTLLGLYLDESKTLIPSVPLLIHVVSWAHG